MAQTSIRHAILAAIAAVLLAPALSAQAFSCPATLTVTEQPQGPAGWTGPAVKSEHAFQTASILNGTPGKEEYDLRPDDEATKGKTALMTWDLKAYRTMPLFVRCHYFDTKATVTATIPASVAKCTVTIEMTANGTIVGKSTMKCQ